MKIKYEFTDGTVSEVEVEETIGAVIIEDRRLEDNLSRKERYHCYSLDAAQFEGAEYASEETPEMKMEREMDTERIAQALDGLSEVQRRRLLMLAGGMSVNEIARKEGVQWCGSQHGDLRPEVTGASGLCQMFPAAFCVRGNMALLCMEICEELRYNFGVESDRQIKISPKILERFINNKLNIIVLVLLFVCGTGTEKKLNLEL